MGELLEKIFNDSTILIGVAVCALVVIVGIFIVVKVVARNKRIAEEAAREREALRKEQEAMRREEEGARAINERRSVDMDVVNRNRSIDGAATIRNGDTKL